MTLPALLCLLWTEETQVLPHKTNLCYSLNHGPRPFCLINQSLRTLTGLYGPWNYCSNPRSLLLFLASLERLCFTKDIHGLVFIASLRTLERLYSCRDNSYCFYMHTPLMFHICTNYFLYMVIYVITSCVMLWCSLPLPTVRTAWLTLQASDLSLG